MANIVITAVAADDARSINTCPLGVGGTAFLEFKLQPTRRRTESIGQDAYLIALQLRETVKFDMFADERWIQSKPTAGGNLSIYDLRQNLAVEMHDASHTVDFYLPHSLLRAVAEQPDAPQVKDAEVQTGQALHDTVARDLLLSMQPALASAPEEVLPLFVDHVATAIAFHIAQRYGGGGRQVRAARGGLAAWQERRTKELLSANLSGRLSLEELARECQLSVRHFTRAFRQSTGASPYEWLASQRIKQARGLLRHTRQPLVEIAATCGFADQSHFSRAFLSAMGMSPSTWRRRYGHSPGTAGLEG